MQRHAEFARPLLKDQKQLATRATAETVTSDPVHRAAKMDGYVVPIGEFLGDTPIAGRVVFLKIVQRRIGKHNAEAERVVGGVALIARNLGLRPLLAQKNRRVQTSRSTTDNRDLHQSL